MRLRLAGVFASGLRRNVPHVAPCRVQRHGHEQEAHESREVREDGTKVDVTFFSHGGRPEWGLLFGDLFFSFSPFFFARRVTSGKGLKQKSDFFA